MKVCPLKGERAEPSRRIARAQSAARICRIIECHRFLRRDRRELVNTSDKMDNNRPRNRGDNVEHSSIMKDLHPCASFTIASAVGKSLIKGMPANESQVIQIFFVIRTE